jgi:predicted acylesterase/phospholipase RssA
MASWKGVAANALDVLRRSLFDDTRFVVFGGGAMFGAMYIGALQALSASDEARYREWARRLQGCAGTSAGAILAFLVAAGLDPWTMKGLLDDFDIGSIVHDVRAPVLREVLARGGLSSGLALDQLLRNIVRAAVGQEDITLGSFGIQRQLATGIQPATCLIITVTNAHSGAVEFWSPTSKPDVPLWHALRASASVPGLFPAYILDGVPYHDGGVTCNVPCHLFPAQETLTLMVHMGSMNSGAPEVSSADLPDLIDHKKTSKKKGKAEDHRYKEGSSTTTTTTPTRTVIPPVTHVAPKNTGLGQHEEVVGSQVVSQVGSQVKNAGGGLSDLLGSGPSDPFSSDLATLLQLVQGAATRAVRIVQWYMCASQLGPMRACPVRAFRCIPCVPIGSSAQLGQGGAFAFDKGKESSDLLVQDGIKSVAGVMACNIFLLVLTSIGLAKHVFIEDKGGL